jgi:hypothetical protein
VHADPPILCSPVPAYCLFALHPHTGHFISHQLHCTAEACTNTDRLASIAATGDKPAADIAAQTAAALALVSKYFKDTSAPTGDSIDRLSTSAMSAYNYAVAAYGKYGSGATCGNSAAAKNCISTPGNCKPKAKGVCYLACSDLTLYSPSGKGLMPCTSVRTVACSKVKHILLCSHGCSCLLPRTASITSWSLCSDHSW